MKTLTNSDLKNIFNILLNTMEDAFFDYAVYHIYGTTDIKKYQPEINRILKKNGYDFNVQMTTDPFGIKTSEFKMIFKDNKMQIIKL